MKSHYHSFSCDNYKMTDDCDKMTADCDKMSGMTSSSDVENDRNEDNESIATTPSTISNCTSIMTCDTSDSRSKTLPRRKKTSPDEDIGQFKDYPVKKEGNYTACVIGGVVHKIPVPTANQSSEEDSANCYSTMKTRKRHNKRSSWSISSKCDVTPPVCSLTILLEILFKELSRFRNLVKSNNPVFQVTRLQLSPRISASLWLTLTRMALLRRRRTRSLPAPPPLS